MVHIGFSKVSANTSTFETLRLGISESWGYSGRAAWGRLGRRSLLMGAMPANKKKKSSKEQRRSVSRKAKPHFGPDGAGEKQKSSSACPIVGIGGSAGGFEAAMEFLRNLPQKTGMAFVIVQHLDPHHASRLSNLLGKVTAMPVSEVTRTTTPKPNAVYVQPPNKCVIAKNGALTLVRREERLNIAIDHFFESLAEECGSRAIGTELRFRFALEGPSVCSRAFRFSVRGHGPHSIMMRGFDGLGARQV